MDTTQGTKRLSELTPRHSYDASLESGENPFALKFADLDEPAWLEILKRSVTEPVIDGVEFPRHPEAELQARIHGTSGESGVELAFRFYSFCRDNTYGHARNAQASRFLDFASGWGWISRPFMRDFPLGRLFGYDPNLLFCAIARSLHPYMSFLQSPADPNDSLPSAWFDVVVAYSIFSHLSAEAARRWLVEIHRAMRPGGWLIFTTYGRRFFDWLEEAEQRLRQGLDTHWHAEQCVRTAGGAGGRREEYEAGRFVFFSSKDPLYGEAAMPRGALSRILAEDGLDFEILNLDDASLPQDAYVLRRGGTSAASRGST